MLKTILDLFFHLDKNLNQFATDHRTGVYGLLVAIIFCETGLVATPLLPGDSLLFAVGALAASVGSPISLPLVILLLCLAANCGDAVNYTIGYHLGPRVFRGERSFLFSRKHLEEAQGFYEKHGRKTIIMARFVPIIRTFAPFVAGIGKMNFFRFAAFSVSGGILWVTLLTLSGYYFGHLEIVKKYFELVVLAIIFISLLPMVVHYLASRTSKNATKPTGVPQSLVAETP